MLCPRSRAGRSAESRGWRPAALREVAACGPSLPEVVSTIHQSMHICSRRVGRFFLVQPSGRCTPPALSGSDAPRCRRGDGRGPRRRRSPGPCGCPCGRPRRSPSGARRTDRRAPPDGTPARVEVEVEIAVVVAGTDTAGAPAGPAELFAGWVPGITALIHVCEGSFVPRPLFALPPGLTWPATPGVTLLGDAAHLMPPVGQGQGANLAMLDTAGLALALAASPGDQEGALRRYGTVMFARASEAARGVGVHRGPPHVPPAAQDMLRFFQPAGRAGGRVAAIPLWWNTFYGERRRRVVPRGAEGPCTSNTPPNSRSCARS